MKAPTRQQLIEKAWTKVGASGPYDFVRKLDLGPEGYQKVYRWRKNGRLDYEDAWKMLDALGWVRTEPAPGELAEEFVTRLDAGEKVSQRDRERVATQVERLAEGYLRLAERLRANSQRAAK